MRLYFSRFFLFIFLILPSTSFGQSERPDGILIPVATLGNVSEIRRQILQNTLIENLSNYYRLVPQDRFEEIQEKIFQEMDYDECTEDQCIVLIQEALQIENLFVFQVIGEGIDTQLSLKWVGLYDRKVKTDICVSCGTLELNKRIAGLVVNLISLIPESQRRKSLIDQEELDRKRKEELDRKRREELDRKRKEELDRKRKEELDRKRKEELDRKRKEELDRKRKEELDRKKHDVTVIKFQNNTVSSESSKILFYFGSSIGSELDIYSISLNYLYHEFGLGLSSTYSNQTNKSKDKYNFENNSLDLLYYFKKENYYIFGLNYFYSGSGQTVKNYTKTKYESTDINGFGIFGMIEINVKEIDTYLGWRYFNVNYKSSNLLNYNMWGLLFNMGLGMTF